MNKNNLDLTKKQSYFYDLPEDLIAQTPAEPRDSARLLCFDPNTKQMEHEHFFDITKHLKSGDVLVVNNTKVIPARLLGIKPQSETKCEVFLLKRKNLTDWECLVKPGRRLKEGAEIVFSKDLSCTVLNVLPDGNRVVKFQFNGVFENILNEVGHTPLPPYIHTNKDFKERYNTVYAKNDGSSAAPTAGLHFTTELLEKIKDMGVEILEVNLCVGLGTFRPVKQDSILAHKMHSEYFEVSKEVADKINKAKAEGRRIIAVGTTSVRTLESACENRIVKPKSESTEIFIYPNGPKKFEIVDGLITNFHLPESTLIMLVSAFIGYDECMEVYRAAVKEKYRFFSFGDACFFLKNKNL